MLNNEQLPLITASTSNYFKLTDKKVSQNSWVLEDGSVIPFANKTSAASLEPKDLEFLANFTKFPKEIFLIGCGKDFIIPNFELRSYINNLGFRLEWMITPSAYHTWNFIIQDYRNVVGLFFL
ncbi:Mth938-like domain-containing protein [Rickettsiales bacterium LUAb2]